jgi:type IV pilus assembly protein PilC
MFLSSRLSLSNLIELCRVSRHYLSAGLPIQDVFRQQARSGALGVRAMAGRIADELGRGESLEDALERESALLPPLLLDLARVGEQTGMLPEVFSQLEKYYIRQQQLWRQFLAQITWPLIQFFLAIFVLAGLIFLMGAIADSHGGKPLDPLGLGLAGPSGAIIFLGVVFGTLFGLAGAYWFATRTLHKRALVHAFLLDMPALGPCRRALALTRFCMALSLTTETSMSLPKAIRLSLRATGDQAYVAQSEMIEFPVRKGMELHIALASSRLFPHDFVHIVEVGEESGQLSEVLARQALHYHEESGRRLTALTAVAGYGVWMLVGIAIIVAIFRIFSWYVNLLNSF